jgi:hypothetical protein
MFNSFLPALNAFFFPCLQGYGLVLPCFCVLD